MSGLPAGWVAPRIDEITIAVNTLSPNERPEQSITYFDISSIDTESGTVQNAKKLLGRDAPSRAKQVVKEGDVLFSTVRPNLRAIALVPTANNGVASTGFCVLRGEKAVKNKYLYYFVKSESFLEKMLSLQRGSSYPAVRNRDVFSQKIPLAPFSEQTRIVAKLDALLTELDAGVAQLKAAQKKLVQYRQSLLKAAVEGTLTAAWREAQTQQNASAQAAETGEQLLGRILTERRSRWQAKQLAKYAAQGKPLPKDWQSKYPEPVKPDTSALAALPQGWVWASVDQLAEVFLGKMLDKSKHTSGKKLPYLRNINVRWGEIETSDVSTMFFEGDEIDRYSLKVGDVLVCEGGEPGRAAICNTNHEAFMYQKALHRVRTFGFYAPELLVAYLEFITKSGGLDKVFTGSTINHFTKECFVVLQIPLPPLDEQAIIIDSLTDSLASLETQTTAISFSLKQSAAQRKNILKAAFAGELVPQDPLDEPASALLGRIAAQRTAQQLANASSKQAKSRRKGVL